MLETHEKEQHTNGITQATKSRQHFHHKMNKRLEQKSRLEYRKSSNQKNRTQELVYSPHRIIIDVLCHRIGCLRKDDVT